MNKNTKQAHKNGYSSMDDMNRDGNKLFKGSCCDTSWDNPKSKKNARKIYKRAQS